MSDSLYPHTCPACKVDLVDTSVTYPGGMCGYRVILCTPWNTDTGLYWMCPDCLHAWEGQASGADYSDEAEGDSPATCTERMES